MNPETNPLVSIVTPFLNAGKYIREAVESVFAQTYPHWELILVDDGSVDNSSRIAGEYARGNPSRVQILEHENRKNKGISASRNLAFKHSKGHFISFLDADDVYLPRKLEDQVSILLNQPKAAMLYAATEFWHGWTGDPEDLQKDRVWNGFGVPPNQLVEPPELLRIYLEDVGTIPCMGSLLVRREVIELIQGWEDCFHDMYEDQIFHAKVTSRWPVFVADGCWDKYRQHPDSVCHISDATGKSNSARQAYLMWLEVYLTQQGMLNNNRLRSALANALRPFRHPLLHELSGLINKGKQKIRYYTG